MSQGGLVEAHRSVLAVSCDRIKSKLSSSTAQVRFNHEVNKDDLLKVLEFIYCGKVSIDSKDRGRISNLAHRLGVRGWPALSCTPDSSVETMYADQPMEDGQDQADCLSSGESLQDKKDVNIQKREGLFEVEDRRWSPTKRVKIADEESSQTSIDDISTNWVTLDDFPDEILIQILSYVPTYDLIRNVALVSKRFERLTKDPGAHTHVSIPYNVDLKGASMFLSQMVKIIGLEIFTPKDQIHLQSGQGWTNQTSYGEKRFRRCDTLILSIANHPNVLFVIVEGMKLTADTLAFLSTTTFFNKLEILCLWLDLSFGLRGASNDLAAAGIGHLAKIGKLSHLRLRGIENVSPSAIIDLAKSCPNLRMLDTDANLKRENINSILNERSDSLEFLKGRKPVHLCGPESLQVLAKASKMKSLQDFGIPYFKRLLGKSDLESLFITVTQKSEMEQMVRDLKAGGSSNVTALSLYTCKFELSIYPFLSAGFPNLTKLLLFVNNSQDYRDIFSKAIQGLDKLALFGIQLKTGSVLNFDFSDIFTEDSGKNLKMILFDSVMNRRLQAKKLFRKLPCLELAISKSRCFVKPDATFKSVMGHLRTMNDERMTVVVLDDINDDSIGYSEFI